MSDMNYWLEPENQEWLKDFEKNKKYLYQTTLNEKKITKSVALYPHSYVDMDI